MSDADKESIPLAVERDDRQRRGILVNRFVLFIILVGLAGNRIVHYLQVPHAIRTSADVHPWPGTIENCTNWSTPRAEFTLPHTSHALRLLSHRNTTGSFHLVQDLDPGDNVRIEVLPADPNTDAFQQVRVCAFTRPWKDESEHGISILPPRDLHINFNVTLHLPKPAHEGSKIYINVLDLDLSLFNHTIADIGPTVEFGYILLKTGPGDLPVTVQSLSAANAILSTINSHISGNFSVSEALVLSTTNGKISANVVLENNAHKEIATRLSMMSQGAPIEASIALSSSSPISNQYFITARTQFSPISLTFPPFLPSTLTPLTLILTALTAHAPLTVTLPPTYRGEYSVSTDTDGPTLQPRVVLVNGEGRILEPMVRRSDRGEVRGAVWDEGREGEGEGVVKLGNVFAPAVLIL